MERQNFSLGSLLLLLITLLPVICTVALNDRDPWHSDLTVDFGGGYEMPMARNEALFNECFDPAALFFNALLFQCPVDDAFQMMSLNSAMEARTQLSIKEVSVKVYGWAHITGTNIDDKYTKIYGVQYTVGVPGPGPDSGSDFKQPYFDSFYSCYEATDAKSCHIEGATRFFGEEVNQQLNLSSGEVLFGNAYRYS